jgi:MFS transporter, NNP family, nitrate/nitrite transporter
MRSENTTPLNRLNVFSRKGIQMRTFHITWLTFFFCFFGWFGIAPLMPLVKAQLHLTKGQVGNIVIASVSATIFARLLVGWLCDRIGPRITYTALLIAGSIPVIFIGFSNSYESFLIFRLAIGVIGAAFVITQYHTSAMFAPNVVGTANAVAAGWGNLGGGVTQLVMPLIAAALVALGFVDTANSWRPAMVIPGIMLLVMALLYYRYTTDTPKGNFSAKQKEKKTTTKGSFAAAIRDYRTWVLAIAYAACFGIEITIDNVAATYFVDNYKATLIVAGALASIFGFMNLFARALGGIFSDRVGNIYGLRGKSVLLALFLVAEGLGILVFSKAGNLPMAIVSMLIFALFLKMANGATYSIVPFLRKDGVGAVAGIVGAGGNLGAMIAGFLFKSASISYAQAFFYIGIATAAAGLIVLVTKFSTTAEAPVTTTLPVLQSA